jgi:hypothetical protein
LTSSEIDPEKTHAAAEGLWNLQASINAPPLGWDEIKKMRDEGRR